MTRALLVIDMQNDFMATGPLAINNAQKLVPIINQLMNHFAIVLATKDWHPADHQSFASMHENKNISDKIILMGQEQNLWPEHCVMHTRGAEFVEGLNTHKICHTTFKGTDRLIDSYSAFFDNAHLRSTDLDKKLKELAVDTLFLCGVATDYCVKFTALDALSLGYKVYVVKDACRGVELEKGDIDKSLSQIEQAGVNLIESNYFNKR